MNDQCTNQKIGKLIAAYELEILEDDERRQFEIHLMECEHCLKQVRDNRAAADTLLHSDDARRTVDEALTDDHPAPIIARNRLRLYLWPDIPLLFRPAFGLLLVLILLIPAVVGIRGLMTEPEKVPDGFSRAEDDNQPRAVQTIILNTNRSYPGNNLKISTGLDAVIRFPVPTGDPERTYHVRLLGPQREVIYENPDYDVVDDLGMGQVLVPRKRQVTGQHDLWIWPTTPGDTLHLQFVLDP